MIPRIFTQQQSHIVQGCFKKLSEPWISDPQSLCLSSLTDNQFCTCSAHKAGMEQGVKQAATTASSLCCVIHGKLHSTHMALEWPHTRGCRDRDWGDSLGLRAKPQPGKLEILFYFCKWLLYIPKGHTISITERPRKRICADADHWPGVACSLSKWDSAERELRDQRDPLNQDCSHTKSILCTVSTRSQSCAFLSGFQGQTGTWWCSGLTSTGFQAFILLAVTRREALQQGSPGLDQDWLLMGQNVAQGMPKILSKHCWAEENSRSQHGLCLCISPRQGKSAVKQSWYLFAHCEFIMACFKCRAPLSGMA